MKIHKACNEHRKKEYQHWIISGCDFVKSHNPKKAWQWIKRTAKVGKSNLVSSHPIKDKNENLVSSTKEQLKVWQYHYKKLASDPSGVSLSLDYWSEPTSNEYCIDFSNEIWDINQDISLDEIQYAIQSTPNYKASGPDGIPIEFYKALISDIDNDESTSPGINCLHMLFNRIWNGDFPNTWNKASIVSIPKKGDPTNCDNYRGISLINNGIKLISKIIP